MSAPASGHRIRRRTRSGGGSPVLDFVLVATLAVGWIGFCYACGVLAVAASLDWLKIPIEPMPGQPISKATVAVILIGFVLATLAAFYGTRVIAWLVRGGTIGRRDRSAPPPRADDDERAASSTGG